MENYTNDDKQNFLKHFLTVAPKHCDNCGARYFETDFKVIKTNNTGIVMHLRCHECTNTYVLNIMNPVNGMVGAQRSPFNSDLIADQEIESFAGCEPVNRNDALDAYNIMAHPLRLDDLKQLLGQD